MLSVPLQKYQHSSAKAAISNFTQWLAVYFSNVGIRVNAIAPGFFITEQTRPLLINEDGSLSARGKAEWNRNLALIAKTLRKINVKTLRKKLSTFNSFA